MAILYTLTEIGGVLLAITFHPDAYGVGASCSGYGLLGFYAAYIFTNWQYMGRTVEWQRLYLTAIVILFFVMNMGPFNTWESANIGHQGGLITGIFVGLTLSEQYDYNALSADPERIPDRYTEEEWKDRSKCRNCFCARLGLVLLISWFTFLFCLFYLYTDVEVE